MANKKRVWSEESKQKLKNTMKQRLIDNPELYLKWRKGLAEYQKTDRYEKEKHRKVVFTEEHRRNLSIANKNRIYTDANKRRISECGKARSIPIDMIDVGGNHVKSYPSIISVEIDGFNRANVQQCLKHPNYTHRGYHWAYHTA